MGKFIVFILAFLMTGVYCLAQDGTMPTPPPNTEDVGEFLTYVFGLFGDWQGFITWQAKIIAGLYILIGLWKVSILKPLWDKLGKFKALVAPVLSLIVTIVLATQGDVTFEVILIALTSGAGALALADILDFIKKLPGIGTIWVKIIEILEKLLGAEKVKVKK